MGAAGIPRHAFRWRITAAVAGGLPLRTRRKLLCATASAGSVPNMEHALEVTGLDLGASATASALLCAAAAAKPQGLGMIAFLLDRRRSQLPGMCGSRCSIGPVTAMLDEMEPALCSAAAAGWQEACELLLGPLQPQQLLPGVGGYGGSPNQQQVRQVDEPAGAAGLTVAKVPHTCRRQQQPHLVPLAALTRHLGKAVLAALRGGHLPLAAWLQQQQGRRQLQLQRLESPAVFEEADSSNAAAAAAGGGNDGVALSLSGDERAALLAAAAAGLELRPLQLVVLCSGDLGRAAALLLLPDQAAQKTSSELAVAAAAAAAADTRPLAAWQRSAVVSAAAGSRQPVGPWADKLSWLTAVPPQGLGFPRPAGAATAVVASAGSDADAAAVALQRLQWLRGADYRFEPGAVVAAAGRGDVRLLEALLREEGGLRPGKEAAHAAAAAAAQAAVLPPLGAAGPAKEGAHDPEQAACGRGRVSAVPALRLLHVHGCAIDPYGTLLVAAESGDMSAVRWLLTGQEEEEEGEEEERAQEEGGLGGTTYPPVAARVRLDAEVMGAAASSGHIPLMAWLLRRRGCAMDSDAFCRCAAGGSVEALRWLAAAGCDIGADGGAAAAASQGDRLMAAALQQLGGPGRGADEAAAATAKTCCSACAAAATQKLMACGFALKPTAVQ
ncbi:hypothetical protein HXX76_014695 [Chlamydomonas incerta]|uniref:Uncharacterized protein n=1 Tax=Chlamydomonas incerta TaxID=51695 RepID=A0A835SBC4_CHLIN|nr:hypothetical protein HXX76_014695 [Chlamydomonas incerta]|eukprot:KAG2424162.1 hypothetical protein HXX76_014695 [Chlamydomonas incerta]